MFRVIAVLSLLAFTSCEGVAGAPKEDLLFSNGKALEAVLEAAASFFKAHAMYQKEDKMVQVREMVQSEVLQPPCHCLEAARLRTWRSRRTVVTSKTVFRPSFIKMTMTAS